MRLLQCCGTHNYFTYCIFLSPSHPLRAAITKSNSEATASTQTNRAQTISKYVEKPPENIHIITITTINTVATTTKRLIKNL